MQKRALPRLGQGPTTESSRRPRNRGGGRISRTGAGYSVPAFTQGVSTPGVFTTFCFPLEATSTVELLRARSRARPASSVKAWV